MMYVSNHCLFNMNTLFLLCLVGFLFSGQTYHAARIPTGTYCVALLSLVTSACECSVDDEFTFRTFLWRPIRDKYPSEYKLYFTSLGSVHVVQA